MNDRSYPYPSPFRSEALVSDGDLRLEVAKAVVHQVGRNEQVLLRNDKRSVFLDSLLISRGSSTHTVHGDYRRISEESDIIMLDKGGSYSEVVAGGVDQHASVEGESMIGGVYTYSQVGPFTRMAAFCDFLAWGGWAEVDATRVELAVTAIRSYMGYVHGVGMRNLACGMLFDDWINRTENFGTFVDNQAEATILGGVGAVVQNEV